MTEVCFECGSQDDIHQHHVVPKVLGGTRTIPLCVVCHGKVHGKQLNHRELILAGQAKARAAGKRWGGADNTKNIGKEEFVRRTKEGQENARKSGKTIGRNINSQRGIPKKVTEFQRSLVLSLSISVPRLSLETIAKQVGLSRPTVTKIINGRKNESSSNGE